MAGTVLAVTSAKGRVNVPAGRTGDDEAAHRSAPFGRESEQARSTPPGTPGGNGQTSMEPGNRALMVLGLGVLAVSLIMPFARNEAGCLDHCYDARDWYWWVPTHNLGAPLLLIGVAGASMRLRSRPTRWAPVRLSALCGWVGAAFTCLVAPSWIDEFLYGGPEAEILPALWLAPAGWALLWAGTVRLPRAVARMPGLNWRGDRHRDGLTTA